MESEFIPVTSITSGIWQTIASDIFCLPVQIVNICLVGNPKQDGQWTLVDAGMPQSADTILQEITERFGKETRPNSIVLTHGHFDHVGAVKELAERWDVPVYAHDLEMPYLTGQRDYPPANPAPEGLVAKMSLLFPRHSIDLGSRVHPLPSDGRVPDMPGWRWIHTPGHTPGHVSFYRDADRALLAGDAFVTVKQESLYKVITQEQELHGPPAYFTTDWESARESITKLAALTPSVAVTGHGIPMSGEELTRGLDALLAEYAAPQT